MAKPKNQNSGPVYSTAHGRMCSTCGKPAPECICRQKKPPRQTDGIVRVSRETKGRKGKGVTIISGLPLDPDAVKQLAKQLKAKCGSGGTVKDGAIEIQGDRRDTVARELEQLGWPVKHSGG
ncbi:MAG: translation initiation factor Sui1 [Thermodesulfobacteriota bacterium]